MKKFELLIVICLSFFTCQLSAQVKNEREFRIELASFPEKVQRTLQLIPEKAKRISFYKEIDGDKSSFECKFKYDGNWYSVEFNTDGILEDIEIKIRKSKIDDAVLDEIENYLDTHFKKFDYIKIQKQFLQNGQMSDGAFFLAILNTAKFIQPSWEIVLMLKIDRTYEIQELTFNERGSFINARTLEPTSYENIMF